MKGKYAWQKNMCKKSIYLKQIWNVIFKATVPDLALFSTLVCTVRLLHRKVVRSFCLFAFRDEAFSGDLNVTDSTRLVGATLAMEVEKGSLVHTAATWTTHLALGTDFWLLREGLSLRTDNEKRQNVLKVDSLPKKWSSISGL